MIRTPKEWDEPCKECRGTGSVHKRERFSLWTPEEYEKIGGSFPTIDPKRKGYKNIPSNALICEPMAGGSIFETIKEGIALAKQLMRPVVFEFNEVVTVCHADSDPEEVSKNWWKLAYNETYEQSMARR